MSNAIQFLETLAHRPALSRGTAEAYALSVANLSVDDVQRKALLGFDFPALERSLNARSMMFCMITAPEEAPGRSPDEQDDGDVPGPGDDPDDKI